MFAGMNPWLTMWSQPKSTIRALVHAKPTYGVLYLASMYALQSFFFYANWWSIGLSAHFYLILLVGLILCPLMGFFWLYYMGFIFRLTGRLLNGQAPASHLRAALAWSHIPYSINLLMWFVLIFTSTDIFIHDAEGPSALFINFITLALSLWTLVLLLQTLRELQQFTIIRSLLNILLAYLFSSIILILGFGLIRYVYIINN